MTDQTWARTTTSRVATEVKKLRAERTTQWLSNRTGRLGHRISRSRISDLERGDRGGPLGVAELIVLAKALDVPPLLLLYPRQSGGEVEVMPEMKTSSWAASQWFSGRFREGFADSEQRSSLDRSTYEDGASLLRLGDQEVELLRLLEELLSVRVQTDALMENMRQRDDATARLREVRRQIDKLGGQPFPWPAGVVDAEVIAGLVGGTKADQ